MIEALQTGGVILDPSALKEMQEVRELVTQLRALKAERNLSNNRNIAFSFVANNEKAEAVSRNLTSILSTAGASAVTRVEEAPQGIPALVTPLGSFFLDLTVGVDLSAEKELEQYLDRVQEGRTPTLEKRALKDGALEQFASLHEVTSKIDEGKLLDSENFLLSPKASYFENEQTAYSAAIRLLIRRIQAFQGNERNNE